MTKESLGQYSSLVKEYGEVREKIERNRRRIEQIGKKIESIECEGVVKDKVYGGEGGVQGFVIEGYASGDYSHQKSSLLQQELQLLKNQAILEDLSMRIAEERNEIEEFIAHVDDSHIRRILNFRLVQGLQWDDIAARIGGGNTAISVRVAYHRFVDGCFNQ